MASLRHRLEQQLWAAGCRVGVLPSDTDSPQLTSYPVFLPHGVTLADVDRTLPDIAGRLGLPALRSAWRADGLLELQVPKGKRQTVTLDSVSTDDNAALPWLCGIDTSGKTLTLDVSTMPHALVVGSTGSGKSTATAAALCHLLANRTPSQVRMVLIDPKMTDLQPFANAPHTLTHVSDMTAAADILNALTREMTRRMATFSRAGARDITAYNAKHDPIPRLVVVFDELAAAMDTHSKTLETPLLVLLQQARAAGIHCLLTLQRPDGDVLPVRMRNNLPVRIAFRLADPSASRLVLNDAGACGLLGRGDGLVLDSDGVLTRFQSPFATDADITKTLRIAARMDCSSYHVDGLATTGYGMPSFEGLSDFDAAVLLCEQLEWISPADLLEHGIVRSRSKAKQVLSALRDSGYIGGYDPAINKSPVVMQRSQQATHKTTHDHGKTTKKPVVATHDHVLRGLLN